MKISIQTKMQLLFYRLFYKNKYSNPLIKIGAKGTGAKKILFLLPSLQKQAQMVSYFAKINIEHPSRFNFIVHEKGLSYYKELSNQDIIVYTDNDMNWFGGIKSKLIIERIGEKNFDALVDLCQCSEQSLSLLTTKFNIPIKIGFQSSIAEHLYSIIIEPRRDGFIEANYLRIESILGISNK